MLLSRAWRTWSGKISSGKPLRTELRSSLKAGAKSSLFRLLATECALLAVSFAVKIPCCAAAYPVDTTDSSSVATSEGILKSITPLGNLLAHSS